MLNKSINTSKSDSAYKNGCVGWCSGEKEPLPLHLHVWNKKGIYIQKLFIKCTECIFMYFYISGLDDHHRDLIIVYEAPWTWSTSLPMQINSLSNTDDKKERLTGLGSLFTLVLALSHYPTYNFVSKWRLAVRDTYSKGLAYFFAKKAKGWSFSNPAGTSSHETLSQPFST